MDESYREPAKQSDKDGYYIIAGSVLTKDTLEGTRIRLQEIVGHNHFHTTEALQTTDGTHTVHALLDQCHQWEDKHLLVVKTRLGPGDDTEHARQQCLTALIRELDTNTRAIIFEKRQHNKDNNADQALIKKLRNQKLLPQSVRTVWVSPSDEKLLWLPDLVAMAYRRTITHTDDTRLLFPRYLQQSATIIPIPNTLTQGIPETSFSLLEHPTDSITTALDHATPYNNEPETARHWELSPTTNDEPLEN
ncbi:hypothetical protein [Corynebacterium mustelae]|uniref:hypothetical protein n=1 Tax=Corynebacterium mustelae TaxID=571915 RepID=UPI0011874463|nr:hypothetical protein [Corynebacterium mustelae]